MRAERLSQAVNGDEAIPRAADATPVLVPRQHLIHSLGRVTLHPGQVNLMLRSGSMALLFPQVNRVTPHWRLIDAAPTLWIAMITRR